MKYEAIIERLNSIIVSKYGEIMASRAIKERYNIDIANTFSCVYEYLISNDLYTLSIWGDYDCYCWKISKLMDCDCVDNRP